MNHGVQINKLMALERGLIKKDQAKEVIINANDHAEKVIEKMIAQKDA